MTVQCSSFTARKVLNNIIMFRMSQMMGGGGLGGLGGMGGGPGVPTGPEGGPPPNIEGLLQA